MNSDVKTILITGASGNLGVEVVKALYQVGHELFAVTGRKKLADELKSMVVEETQVDLTMENAAETYVTTLISSVPALDTAVLLVGGFEGGDMTGTKNDAIDKQIALNFKSAYNVVRPLLSHFEKNGGGQFVLIGARPAFDAKAGKDFVAYSLSKSMVIHLSELINAWGRGKGVHATVIVPSVIDTAENRESMPKADPSKWVKASDIARTIAFVLSSPGQNLRDTVVKVYNEA